MTDDEATTNEKDTNNNKKNVITILHVLSQRPSKTGSGVTLDALVRYISSQVETTTDDDETEKDNTDNKRRLRKYRKYEQHVIVGTPIDDPQPQVGELSQNFIHPFIFGSMTSEDHAAGNTEADTETDGIKVHIPYQIPGMSDVMPYPSSVFSKLTSAQLQLYIKEWKRHIIDIIQKVKPTII